MRRSKVMSKKLDDLRAQRAEKGRELRNLNDNTAADQWGEEQQSQYDAALAEIDRIDAAITREEQIAERDVKAMFERDDTDDKDAPAASQLFNTFVRDGFGGLTPEMASAYQAQQREIRALEKGVGEKGGVLAPDEFQAKLIEAMKAYGGVFEVANVITTTDGNTFDMPITDATAETGEWLAEKATASDSEASFGTVALPVHKGSSKVVEVSLELLQDSAIDIESYLARLLGMRLGRLTSAAYATGDGAGKPTGVITSASLGHTSSQKTALKYQDLLKLEHSVNRAYRANARFMFTDKSLLSLKGEVDGQGRPLWLPGASVGAPDTIDGKPYTVCDEMDEIGAGKTAAAFGDFSYYTIRNTASMPLLRFDDSAYMKRGMVGFLMFLRTGGVLTDNNAIKTLKMAA